jgi:catechol 2,3-dioxygenase-like lactoylglutathione lyase family enzyme
MEPRISIVTLGVADLERSLRFYRDGLGFPTTWSPERGVIFFQTRGVTLALWGLKDMAQDIDPAAQPERAPFTGINLAHNTRTQEEVDVVLQLAAKAGGKIVKPGHKTFWGGYSGYFADPDGHVWEVACGAFPFNADGSLAIP